MPTESSPALLSLLGLRLKGFAEAQAIADLVGLELDAVTGELTKAAESEFTSFRDGRRTGWTLMPAGRAEIERLAAEELDAVGCRDIAQSTYEQFLELNGRMLQTCTDWQVKDIDANELNDHTDAEYDAGVIADLVDLDNAVQPLCNELASHLSRFSIYAPRFTAALDKVHAGDTKWFTGPIIESHHTVWFEFHEDLLATLGIDRASEGSHG